MTAYATGRRRPRWRASGMTGAASRYLALLVVCVLVLLPIYWGLITSLRPTDQIASGSTKWIPTSVTFAHYMFVFTQTNIPANLVTTLIVSVVSCAMTLVVSAHGAYACARFNFKGRNLALFALLATSMIPGIVTLLPQYLIASALGLIDTKLVLELVFTAWQIPLTVWILRGFFLKVPAELDEAAMVDGCTRLGAFYRVVLPLSVPGLAAAGVVVFVWCWNEFIIALTLTSHNAVPLTVGLYTFESDAGVDYGSISAASMIALVPVLLIFIFLQRRFVQGLTAGSVR